MKPFLYTLAGASLALLLVPLGNALADGSWTAWPLGALFLVGAALALNFPTEPAVNTPAGAGNSPVGEEGL